MPVRRLRRSRRASGRSTTHRRSNRAHASRRTMRRNHRRSRRVSSSRRRALRMHGGAQQVVRFKVNFLEDIDANNDADDLSDAEIVNLVSQNSNKFYDAFNAVIRDLMESGEIDEEDTENFRFTHLGENRFEMKFELLNQSQLSQQIAQETIDLVIQGIIDYPSVNVDDKNYIMNVEKEEQAPAPAAAP